ncbi:hypothetical protein [Pedobacter namyangjuensis]|nr:hypothetical protein [Pedobacter namyangjuensis]
MVQAGLLSLLPEKGGLEDLVAGVAELVEDEKEVLVRGACSINPK